MRLTSSFNEVILKTVDDMALERRAFEYQDVCTGRGFEYRVVIPSVLR